MSSETVSIRLEGGIGDHLLSNRFVSAIREYHPHAQFNFYSDTENNPKQIDLLKATWPSIYTRDNCKVMEGRISKSFVIKSQFGEEIYNCHPLNILEQYQRLFKDSDYYYNLCIDNLEWLNYKFDWKRYFYFFPRPEVITNSPLNSSGYILTHLFPRPDSDHNLEQWYVINLIKKLLERGHKVVSICEGQYMDYYNDIIELHHENFTLLDCTLSEVFSLSEKCACFIGVDSGLRYFPLHFGKPSYVFSKYCYKPFNPIPSHLLRWLIFSQYVLPIHFDINEVCSIITDTVTHPASSFFPKLSSSPPVNIIERIYE